MTGEPPSPQPWFSNRNKIIFGMIAFLTAYFLFDGPVGYLSVCSRCGMHRHSRDWMVPFTHIKLGSVHTETDTPLSTVLRTKQIVPAHAHEWLFIHGSGNGIMCAIGPGSPLLNSTHKQAADTIGLLNDRGKIAFRDRLLFGLLNRDQSGLYRGTAISTPLTTISDADLDAWIDKHSQMLDDLIRSQ